MLPAVATCLLCCTCICHVSVVVFCCVLLHTRHMSAYIRRNRYFERTLQTKADERKLRHMALKRLAAEMKRELTPLQCGYVTAILRSLEGHMPCVIDHSQASGLNASQRNALLLLASTNSLDDLISFFGEDKPDGLTVYFQHATVAEMGGL